MQLRAQIQTVNAKRCKTGAQINVFAWLSNYDDHCIQWFLKWDRFEVTNRFDIVIKITYDMYLAAEKSKTENWS